MIDRDKHNVVIDPKYADDITFIRSHQTKTNQIKRILPGMLEKGNLLENQTKREEYHIPGNDNTWKTCKLLGSLMDTESDINRRKGLAVNAMKTLTEAFKSHTLLLSTKLKIFESYVQSIFLYNCELWAITKTIAEQIDSFHRRLLRDVLGVKYPRIMKNEEVYNKTSAVKWSTIVTKRRLSWLGHLLRLDDDTPAKQALEEYMRPVPKKRGRRKTCWFDNINKDFSHMNVKNTKLLDELKNLSSDRQYWKSLLKDMMLKTTSIL